MERRNAHAIDRRTFVLGSAILAAGLLAGCASEAPRAEDVREGPAADPGSGSASEPQTAPESAAAATAAETDGGKSSDVLLVYFSRAGMNYAANGPVHTDVGNTAVVAGFVEELLGCDVYEIVPAEEYPYDYDETTALAQREKAEGARPAIADALPDLSGYGTILVGSGVWWGEPPMIMHTFFEGVDTAGKAVVPFTTHAGSGLGAAVRTYRALCPDAIVSDNGLAVLGEEAEAARDEVAAWLAELGL